MPILDANLSHFFFETTDLPPEVFEVANFVGTEEISRLSRFELKLLSKDASIDFASVINRPAVFTMVRGGEPVYFHGLVVHFEQAARVKDYFGYRAVMAPRLWLLSLTHQSRIFQHLTVEEIITQIFEESGLTTSDFRFELSASYEPREYCVQHHETDLNFICRLMEFEGMFFFFEHDGERDILVISDSTSSFTLIEGESTVNYHEEEGMVHEDYETVQALRCQEQIVTGQVVLKDYNYETPDVDLTVDSQLNSDMPGVYYDYGEHYKTPDQGTRLAAVRNEEIEGRRRLFRAWSDCMGFRPGYLYTLESHYRSDFNEDFLLTAVRHEGRQGQALGLDVEARVAYENRIQFRSSSAPYRPDRITPVPQIPGVMVGKIERQAEPYADLDEDGRYKAKMDFDLAETNPMEATKPIRMNQPYSGPGYGVHFPNHEATEMIWACVNGDIDRPIALGTSPNPNNGSPSLSENEWQSVIRTWGNNELTFDDKEGEENIYMHATKDHTVVVTNDESFSVGHDQSTSVGNDQTNSIGNDRTKTVGNDEHNTIHNNRTTVIEEGNELLVVQTADRTVIVETANDTHVVKQDRTSIIESGNELIQVQEGLREVIIKQDDTLVVEDGDLNVLVNTGDANYGVATGNRAVSVKGEMTYASEGKAALSTEDEATILSKKGMTISSTEDKIMINAAKEIVLTVGTSSITIKPDGVTISGPKISSTAVGIHEISGALIKIN